tara:strand:+ start:42 stop:617 length:576 start_codon:yes stop_codon:yes gene_type:complete
MAKKETKAKQHTRDLVGGMKSSNSQSKTPISTLYPKKVTVGSSRTSPAYMNKGTHNPSKSHRPQKFLLSVTDPGNAPEEPISPAEHLTTEIVSYDAGEGEWNTRNRSYEEEHATYLNVVSAHNVWGEEKSIWDTASSNYTRDTGKNTATTSKYNRDVSSFLRGLKGKVTQKQAKSLRGSRNSRTRLGGSRG